MALEVSAAGFQARPARVEACLHGKEPQDGRGVRYGASHHLTGSGPPGDACVSLASACFLAASARAVSASAASRCAAMVVDQAGWR